MGWGAAWPTRPPAPRRRRTEAAGIESSAELQCYWCLPPAAISITDLQAAGASRQLTQPVSAPLLPLDTAGNPRKTLTQWRLPRQLPAQAKRWQEWCRQAIRQSGRIGGWGDGYVQWRGGWRTAGWNGCGS